MPGHRHTTKAYNKNNEDYTSALTSTGYFENGVIKWSSTAVTTAGGDAGDPIGISGTVGGGQKHTHTIGNTGSSSSLQPYITCYMWKRTA